jgi:hypothetical protein
MLRGTRRLGAMYSALGCALALLMALAGCVAPITAVTPTPIVAPAPTPIPVATAAARPTPDSAQIMTRLWRVASLQEAAEQCAQAVDAAAGVVRVRVETPMGDQCVPCNRLPIDYVDRGTPVNEVALPLNAGSWVWLTVDDLLCIYWYDEQVFQPSSVTHW